MKLFFVVAGVAAAGWLGYALLQESSKDSERIAEWPKALVENGYRYCNLTNYRFCAANEWFGIVRDTNLDKQNLAVRAATNGLIDTACQPRSDPPRSRELRGIDIGSSQRLVLCRLREPSTIDRGKMLMYAESTPFKGML